jgi:8-oxo-dGTP pyrophosphatase MutT (NUDIX family)
MTSIPPIARPAATLMLLRGNPNALPEVLLVNRHANTAFGGLYAFPGGVVESEDGILANHCRSFTEQDAQYRFIADCPSIAYWVAALRETFEETGILLANRNGQPIDAEQVPDLLSELRGGSSFMALCEQHQLQLLADELHYIAQWITPEGRPSRFDARFFLATWPTGQGVDLEEGELTHSVWHTAADALQKITAGEIPALLPTKVQLQWLAQFANVEAAVGAGRDCYKGTITGIMPFVLEDGRVVLPDDPEYPR